MTKAPIAGFIRYSCRASFTRSDFFHPKYMDYRLGIFKNITLRSFQEQIDKDFNLLLLHSINLPQKYKDIFQKIEEENNFLYNVYIPDSELEGNDYINAIEGSIKYMQFSDGMAINFRIDNDDAIPMDYISRLKYFLKPEFNGFVISFPNIAIIQRNKKNNFIKQEKYFPSNSIGLAYVTKQANYQTIMTLGDHGKINKNHPMVLIPGRGGIQTINGRNVMNSLYLGYVKSLGYDALGQYLSENGYSKFDFNCLNICRRHIFIDTVIKTKNFIKSRIVTKE